MTKKDKKTILIIAGVVLAFVVLYLLLWSGGKKQDLKGTINERKDAIVPQACINDLIMLGRALILENYDRKGIQEDTVADPNSEFVDTMLDLAAGLRRDESHQLCTINPRKILYGEMVARAHALLENGVDTPPKVKHLAVFRNIWDNEAKAENLRKAVNHRIGHDGLLV